MQDFWTINSMLAKHIVWVLFERHRAWTLRTSVAPTCILLFFWCCMCAGCVLLVPHHGVFFAEVAKNMDRSLYRRLKSKNTKGCQRCIVRISSMHGLWCTMDVLCYTMVLFFIIAKSRNLFQTWKLEMFRSHFLSSCPQRSAPSDPKKTKGWHSLAGPKK